MRKLILLFLLLPVFASLAADSYIKVTLTVTNTPQTSNTITVNGNLRTWTNATTAGTILTNSVGPGPAFTNLYNAFGNYPERATIRTYLSTNSMSIEGTNLAISIGGTWASLTAGTTNTLGTLRAIMVPTDTLSQTNRTNNMSDLAYAIGKYSTNAISGIRLTNVIGLNGTITRLTNGYLTNVITDGGRSTNLYSTNQIIDHPLSTNLVNYGGAISSPGTGTDSERFGSGAIATNTRALAVGRVAIGGGIASTAIGNNAQALGDSSVALGQDSMATAANSVVAGVDAAATGTNAIAIGAGANATHAGATAIGYGAATTTSNQIMLGSATVALTTVNGRIEATAGMTNANLTGSNTISGDVAAPMYSISTLASGNNIAVPATNVFIAASGPSAAFSINGLYGGRTGRWLRLLNRSGQVMTIAHESGVDPTPANRITCSPANDQPFNDGEMVDLWYDGVSSRWRLSVHQTNAVTVATTNGIAAIWTNGVVVTSAGTNLNFLNPGGNGNLSIRTTNTSGKVDLEIRDTTIGSSSGLGTNTAFYGAIVDNGTLNVLGLSTNTGVQNLWLNSSNITVNASNATAIPLTVKGISAGTGDLQQFADSSGYVIAGVRSNGLAFLSVSNSNVQYPACYRIFTQTADSACTNITTTETTWLGTGVGSLVLTQGFWQVGRRIEIEVDGLCWTDVSPGNEAVRLKLGSTVIATNFNVSVIANLASDPFHMRFALTCRTNSNIGFIVAQGEWEYPGAAGSATGRENFFKSADAIFDTTAAMTIDLVSTNGNALNSFRVRNFSAKLIP